MAGFKADGALAAMSQRAHEILRGRGTAIHPDGGTAQIAQPAPPAGGATDFLVERLKAQVGRAGGMAAGLRGNAQSAMLSLMRNGVRPGAPQSQALAAARAAADARRAGGPDMRDFMYGNSTPFGMSDEELYRRMAERGGNGTPVHVMHEGEVTYQDGRPGIFVKYERPDGMDTVWVPVD